MRQAYFISGIGTGVGKTLVSAILTEKLGADYWKPVQSGDLHASDSMSVAALISNDRTRIHDEGYRLNNPLSPHASASLDGITIKPELLKLPETGNDLIVEGAGGLMVPLNERFLVSDLMAQLGLPVILVSRDYLGSINHTLLSWYMVKQAGLPLKGIIFNGAENAESRRYILQYTGMELLGEIPELDKINQEVVRAMAEKINLT
ncbi:dethiobiotin synthase [Pedobacter yulinensis]|uniref:ATP-dependent dethiobiotin synthetase BioD n=1 Tax=Pedobacter yulinensis TaxID=2126353 RepID=A0A2T3HKN4_9SPHI|nr:dethiobiotin synthase [Pedobacter yulinensis]PST82979.1 dethiobiotin synthase [Pedobacter yulinensis]